MAETTLLIPEQAIHIPDELQAMFDVVKDAFDPEAPIRKTTEIVEDANYSTTGNIVSKDAFFMRRLSNPEFHPALTYGVSRFYPHPESATRIISGQRNDQFAKLAFTESHISEDAARLHTSQMGKSIWQLGVEINSRIGEARRSITTIGANSMGEAVGRTVAWSLDREPEDVQTEYLFTTKRFEEIAMATARILMPGI